ncbi:DUF3558 domain-containing protein [Amycolatopsis sp. NPDC005232]|uniref:DUF3558 domain-containing protein n=1 Tax=Amycolatopsis sp. NPDC005232 TaxID=3157027 RepID=UPI0033B1A570
MQSRTLRLAAGTVAALALLTACSGGTGGATPPSASGSSDIAPSGGSGPKVPAPLPTKDLLSDPCSALTSAEATQVGLASPGRKTDGEVTGCTWTSSGNGQNFVAINVAPQNSNGISDIYDQKAQQAYFETVTVDGYPGAFTSKADLRPSGNCQLWLGVTDQLAVSINPQLSVGPNKADPCGYAKRFATTFIAHLKAAA